MAKKVYDSQYNYGDNLQEQSAQIAEQVQQIQELESTASDTRKELVSERGKYIADSEEAQSLRAEKAELESLDSAYKDFYTDMDDLKQRWREGSMSEIEMLERANNLYDVFKNATGEKIDDGLFGEYDGFDNLSEAFDAMSEADSWIDDTRKKLSGMTDDIARADGKRQYVPYGKRLLSRTGADCRGVVASKFFA